MCPTIVHSKGTGEAQNLTSNFAVFAEKLPGRYGRPTTLENQLLKNHNRMYGNDV